MIALKLRGKITADGKLQVELPVGIAPEEVVVTVESVTDDAQLWTDEELAALLTPDPKTGAEIVAEIEAEGYGGWEFLGNMSSEEWVQQQRRKLGERNQW